jgi:hypothetical protein
MAFSTKGWRRIVVGGQVFYWQPPGEPSMSWVVFYARPEVRPHRLLIATSIQCGDQPIRYAGVASPGVVRGCIELAVEAGWPARRPRLRQVLFGDPCRPVSLDPSWLTSTVVVLARGISDEGAVDRLPILADALQEAGCDHSEILDHCRGPGPHVRGCWVVDLLLAEE